MFTTATYYNQKIREYGNQLDNIEFDRWILMKREEEVEEQEEIETQPLNKAYITVNVVGNPSRFTAPARKSSLKLNFP